MGTSGDSIEPTGAGSTSDWGGGGEKGSREPTPSLPAHGGAELGGELPARIGPYRPLSVLGVGGFGVVYLAEQTEPVKRRVALKVIKPGMDTAQVLARFEAERQALALMDHPHIAKVFEAGQTGSGHPYFAMEYAPGEPITDYCDRHRLTTRERLGLFAQVCEAVQHAHTKGIIHRDLKPSNILVGVRDQDRPHPVVIDFGVAKALDRELTERTIFTEMGALIGTPEYMSPEQAEMSALDIDTRSDVYSLGVVLYELLTGALPFDSKSLRAAGFREIQRIIREVDPPRPSTRLSTMGDAKTAAESRRIAVDDLEKQLRSELEWIPLKALRKDRTERYRSAAELADDVRNYLENRPLIAGPESAVYKLRKFVRRNRGRVAAAAALAVVGVAGLAGTGVGLVRAAEAKAGEKAAAGYAEAVETLLSEDLTGAADPDAAGGGVTLAAAMKFASAGFAERFKERPAQELRLRLGIVKMLVNVGDLVGAKEEVARARAVEGRMSAADRSVAGARPGIELTLYESVMKWRAKEPGGSEALRGALVVAEKELGKEDELALLVKHDLASAIKHESRNKPLDQRLKDLDVAEGMYVEVKDARRTLRGAGDPQTVMATLNAMMIPQERAMAYQDRARQLPARSPESEDLRARAKAALDEGLARGERVKSEMPAQQAGGQHQVELWSEMAKLRHRRGDREGAEREYVKLLPAMLEKFGPTHWRTIEIAQSWEFLHTDWPKEHPKFADPARLDGAERAYRAVIGVYLRAEKHWPEAHRAAASLGQLLDGRGRADEAEAALVWAVTSARLTSEEGAAVALDKAAPEASGAMREFAASHAADRPWSARWAGAAAK